MVVGLVKDLPTPIDSKMDTLCTAQKCAAEFSQIKPKPLLAAAFARYAQAEADVRKPQITARFPK
jgi:hypothetical protein